MITPTAVNGATGHVIGIHVEQAGTVAGLSSLTGELVATHRVRVRDRRVPAEEIQAAVDGVLAASGIERGAVHRVVIGSPGVIDLATGRLGQAGHLAGWEADGLVESIEGALGLAGGRVLTDLVNARLRRISFVRTQVLLGALEWGLRTVRAQLFGEPAAASR